MKFLKIILILVNIFIIFMLNVVNANAETMESSFDTSITSWMHQYDIPGVGVSVIENGNIEYSKTYGYANLKENIPLSKDSILRTESISKSITAYMVMILVEEGVLELYQPISQYVDIDIPEEITLHLLLTHQSGLDIGPFSEHYKPDEDKPNLREHLIETIDFKFEPETKFNYSNVGYNLIQYIIETTTGKSFNQNIQEHIFQPFDISDASFEYDSVKENLYAMGYDINGREVEPYVYPDQAAGGLFTDLDAITRLFQQILTRDDVLSENKSEKLYQIYTDASGEYGLVSDGYGYGHFIENQSSKAIFHGGQGHGWMAFYYAHPEDENAIVIITNSQRSYPMISGLINQFNAELRYEKPGLAIIVDAILYVNIFLFIMSALSIYIIYKAYKSLKLKHDVSVRRNLFKIMILIILAALCLYLWFTPYIFIQVLYPIHYAFLRIILSVIWLSFMSFFVYDIYTRVHRRNFKK